MRKKKIPVIEEFMCGQCMAFSSSVFRRHPAHKIDEALLDHRRPIVVTKRGSIIKEGDGARGVFCVYSGYAKIVKHDRRKQEHVVGLIKPGDVLGVESITGQPAYNHSAVALTDISLCFIPKDEFLAVVAKDASLFEDMLRFMCQRLDVIENQLTNISSGRCRERLAALILALKTLCGVDAQQVLNIQLAADDLADILGTTKSSIYRLMKSFKDENLAAMKRDKIQILSDRGLSSMLSAGTS